MQDAHGPRRDQVAPDIASIGSELINSMSALGLHLPQTKVYA
jgi:hypothetical protein